MWFKKKKEIVVPLPPKEKILTFPKPEEVFGQPVPLRKDFGPSVPLRKEGLPPQPTPGLKEISTADVNLPFIKVPIYQEIITLLEEINQKTLEVNQIYDKFLKSNQQRDDDETKIFKNLDLIYNRLLFINKKLKR